MRKILAIICTIITLFAIKESVYIFTTNDIEIVQQRSQLILVALSITLPLVILTIWLWGSRKRTDNI